MSVCLCLWFFLILKGAAHGRPTHTQITHNLISFHHSLFTLSLNWVVVSFVLGGQGGLHARGCGGFPAACGVSFPEPAHEVLADHRARECYGVSTHLACRDIRGTSMMRTDSRGVFRAHVWGVEQNSRLRF